jgi:hypothetical protein
MATEILILRLVRFRKICGKISKLAKIFFLYKSYYVFLTIMCIQA